MGVFLLLRLVLFCLAHILKKLFFLENRFLWVGVVLLLFLFESFLIQLLFWGMGKSRETFGTILKTSMSQGLFTSLFSLLIFPFFTKFEKTVKEWRKK